VKIAYEKENNIMNVEYLKINFFIEPKKGLSVSYIDINKDRG